MRRTTLFWLDDLRRDISYAARGLARNPGFAIAAVVTLALGIGATTAVFSVVDAVLLRPLPYPDSDRLVRIVERLPARGASGPLGRAEDARSGSRIPRRHAAYRRRRHGCELRLPVTAQRFLDADFRRLPGTPSVRRRRHRARARWRVDASRDGRSQCHRRGVASQADVGPAVAAAALGCATLRRGGGQRTTGRAEPAPPSFAG